MWYKIYSALILCLYIGAVMVGFYLTHQSGTVSLDGFPGSEELQRIVLLGKILIKCFGWLFVLLGMIGIRIEFLHSKD